MNTPCIINPLPDEALAPELLNRLERNSQQALRLLQHLSLPQAGHSFQRLALLLQQQNDIAQRLEAYHWEHPFTYRPFRHLSPNNRAWVLRGIHHLLEREAAELDGEAYL